MKLLRRNFLHLAAVAAALCFLSVSMFDAVWSQPARSIKMVVPFAPGGAASVLARLLTDEIAKAQRLTTVVENRPGGGTAIATEAVARAQADGNTLLVNNPALIINPLLKRQNYDPFNSFEPICNLVDSPTFLTVNSGSPYRTLSDLLLQRGQCPAN